MGKTMFRKLEEDTKSILTKHTRISIDSIQKESNSVQHIQMNAIPGWLNIHTEGQKETI